jgi:uncharacterized protein YggT (Ycf19 family)
MPDMGGLDLSPLVVIFAIYVFKLFIIKSLYMMAYSL